jgi:hypothetical protein
MGDSFGEPIPLFPGAEPVYDLVTLDTFAFPFPNEWIFEMEIFNPRFDQTNIFIVEVLGLDTNSQVVVPMPLWKDEFNLPPQPFLLQIDLQADQFIILDGGEFQQLLWQGPWSNFPQLLEQPSAPFAPAGIERANLLPPQPVAIQIEELNLQGSEPIAVLSWTPQQDSQYDIYISTNLLDHPFEPLDTNLLNNVFMVPMDVPAAFFEVKPYAWP